MKRIYLIFAILLIAAIATSCLSYNAEGDINSSNQSSSSFSSPSPSTQGNAMGSPQSAARRQNEPPYRGDGGRGIVVVVPTPSFQDASAADSWIPQFLQDMVTGDLARYSAMTVIDRKNEQLALAEQSLSESGYYSENDYIRMGNMTNAQYIVAGNIQNVSGRYMVSFRINSIETNEIQASFNGQASIGNIESGIASKLAVSALLEGMGIELTDAGRTSLLTVADIPETQVRATAQLARGAVAAKSDNIVEALAFFSEALNSDSTRTEANRNIQSFFVDISTASIRERANYAIVQKEKWEKIFSDLKIYLRENLAIAIYDFSTVEDRISTLGSKAYVSITIKPGIKIIPNRTALLVWKTIYDNWEQVRRLEENRSWANSVRGSGSNGGDSYYEYSISFGLYDEYNDSIKTTSRELRLRGYSLTNLIAQHKYYEDTRFQEISFSSIDAEKISDILTPKINTISRTNSYGNAPGLKINLVMTVAEWQEWLAQQ